jgi:hypothetical protein
MSSLKSAQTHLDSLGFGDFWRELFRPGSPLAFLTAQGLRVAQPVLGAFADPSGMRALEALADRLEHSSPAAAPDVETDPG